MVSIQVLFQFTEVIHRCEYSRLIGNIPLSLGNSNTVYVHVI